MDRTTFLKIKNPTEAECLAYLYTDEFAENYMNFIPKSFRESTDFIMKATKQNAWTLECFDHKFRTQSHYEAAIKQSKGKFFPNVPKEYQTPEICLYAIKMDKNNYRYVEIVNNSDLDSTKENLEKLIEVEKNQQLVKKTINSIKGCSL